MKLEDAWLKIMEMENSEQFGPNQIHSILSDLKVFTTNQRIRLVVKAALAYGLWDIILTRETSGNKIASMRLRLQNDGFLEIIVNEVLSSLPGFSLENDPLIYKELKSSDFSISSSHREIETPQQLHISFMGKELGCDITEMVEFLVNKGFKRTDINDTPKRISFQGSFAGIDNCEVFVWKTISNKVWSIVINMKATFQFIKDLFDSKYDLVERQNYTGKYSHRLIYNAPGGEITIGHSWYDNRISYTDSVTAILNDREIATKNAQFHNNYKNNLKRAAKDI